MNNMPPSPPWYKQFWPWFLLGLLFSSIAVSSTFAVLSLRSFDGMVQEDYYEHGRTINMVLAKQQRAHELNLTADLRIDPLTSDLVVQLDGDVRPEQLFLSLIFPTQDDRDFDLVLEHIREGHYRGQAPDNFRHRWYLQLHPSQDQPEWRLIGEAQFPSNESVSLTPGSIADRS